jgi:L-ribulokinase
VEEAMKFMGQGFAATYTPDNSRLAIYAKRYKQYQSYGDAIQSQTNRLLQERASEKHSFQTT